MQWSDDSIGESGFKIERSANSMTGWTQIATVGAQVTTCTNRGLSSGTTYYYRVRAYNAGSNSGFSNVAQATTRSGPEGPSFPTYLPLALSNTR